MSCLALPASTYSDGKRTRITAHQPPPHESAGPVPLKSPKPSPGCPRGAPAASDFFSISAILSVRARICPTRYGMAKSIMPPSQESSMTTSGLALAPQRATATAKTSLRRCASGKSSAQRRRRSYSQRCPSPDSSAQALASS